MTLRLLTTMCLLQPVPSTCRGQYNSNIGNQSEILAENRFATGLAHFLELAPGCQDEMLHMDALLLSCCQKRGIEDDVFDAAPGQLELPGQEGEIDVVTKGSCRRKVPSPYTIARGFIGKG